MTANPKGSTASETGALEIGQVWRHVGGDGIDPTGLRIKIESFDQFGRAICSYPDLHQGTAKYGRGDFARRYELEPAPAAAPTAPKEAG